MSNSSLGYSFIEGTDKIKEKLKSKKHNNDDNPVMKAANPRVVENFELPSEPEEDESGLANVDFSPPPKPESSGVEKTKDKEKALNRDDQHPAEPFNSEQEQHHSQETYLPFANQSFNPIMNNREPSSTGELERKLNYMIHLLEDQKDERVDGITEEIVLYCFLGVFIIFVLDSFAKVGKYVR